MSPQNHSHLLSGPAELAPVPNISLGKFMLGHMKSHGEKTAQIHAVTGKTSTYGDILRKSLSISEGLRLKGLKSGDVIGVCSENNLDFYLPVLGGLFCGISIAPLNPAYTTRELQHSLSISKPSIVFCSELTAQKMEEVKREVSFIKEIVVFGRPGYHTHVPLDTYLRNAHPEQSVMEGGHQGVAGILCSSGTTGLAKGVMLTDLNIMTTIWHMRDARLGNMGDTDICLGLLPFFHAYGFVSQLSMLDLGITTVVLPKFEEEMFLKSIQNYKVTHMTLVPPLMVFLAKHPLVSRYDLSSVKEIWCGAAPLSQEVQNLVTKRLNIKQIRQGYGMTETTLGVLRTPQDRNKFGSSGTLVPGTECKVVDLESGQPLGPNKSGELCFRGSLIMKGYLGDMQATSACFDSDGFLHSGDIGYYDEDGFFYIVDRLKELIKYNGFQVPPAELEAVLLTNPSIKDTAVIGIPDERAGELPIAYVVLQPGQQLTEAEIIKFVNGQVSSQKRLHGVRFIDIIPKNPSGKILRRELRELSKSKL